MNLDPGAIPPDPDAVGADDFARLALELHEARGMDETLDAVVQFALQAEGCTYAGVTLLLSGRREIGAVTDPVVAELFQLQFELDEGPLLTAIETGSGVIVTDVRAEARWPAWSLRIAEYDVRSILHVPMWSKEQLIGVLSLYHSKPDAFGTDDEAVAHILARHASVAVAIEHNGETMNAAVDARKLVGQAMGILMERFDIDGDRAFEVLRRYSQQTNTKLRDVAQELIDTRKLRHTE
jgi:transcriptional regulator with GAF, ATPase, and Fis domain